MDSYVKLLLVKKQIFPMATSWPHYQPGDRPFPSLWIYFWQFGALVVTTGASLGLKMSRQITECLGVTSQAYHTIVKTEDSELGCTMIPRTFGEEIFSIIILSTLGSISFSRCMKMRYLNIHITEFKVLSIFFQHLEWWIFLWDKS